MIQERDWFAVLKSTLEEDDSAQTLSAGQVDMIIADIVSGRAAVPAATRPRRRKRRWFAIGAVAGLACGGATAAAVWNRSEPDQPQEGIACHASADLGQTRVVVVSPAADPLDACEQLWLSGGLPDIDGGPPTDVVPELFACVGAGDGLEVFPRLGDVVASCADLGLADAITPASSNPLVVLQDRLTNEINAKCTDVDSAKKLAEVALADLGLENWRIVVRPDTQGCVSAGEDPDANLIYLFSLPTPPTT